MKSLTALASQIQALQKQALIEYTPLVEILLRTHSRDVKQIERTLDGLLDFCEYRPILELYRRLCRHYWDIDPAATAFYIDAYRERWTESDSSSQNSVP